MKFSGIVIPALTLSFLMLRVLPSHACAAMTESGSEVRVVDESAVIVWDDKKKTQHFIRNATFDATGKSVGFIVPTPTIPELAEADAAVFGYLEDIIQPEVVDKEYTAYTLASILFDRNKLAHTFNAAGSRMDESVEVVSTQQVGDYDATILRATNAGALSRWLRKHNFYSSAAFEKWLDVYVRKGWMVTAFKVRKSDNDAKRFSTSLVPMSFKTPRPFFPYREPQEKRPGKAAKGRTLRVFFFAPTRVGLETGHLPNRVPWPGKVKWADDTVHHGFKESSRWHWIAEDLKLPEATLKYARWLTVFEDTSAPRPGTNDVYFRQVANKQTLPPPIQVPKRLPQPIYIELIVMSVIAVGALGAFVTHRLHA